MACRRNDSAWMAMDMPVADAATTRKRLLNKYEQPATQLSRIALEMVMSGSVC
jgi:hypothetical protein